MKGYTLQKRKTNKGRVRWTAQVRVHGLHSSKTFQKKTQAETWAISEAQRLRGGGRAENEPLKLVIEAYTSDPLEGLGSISEADQGKRRAKLTWWLERLGNVKVRDLSHLRIREIHRQKAEETTPATANRYLAALSAVFRYALEEGIVGDNPCSKVSRLDEDNERVRYLSNVNYEPHVEEPDEYTRLMRACRNPKGLEKEKPAAKAAGMATAAKLAAMVRFSIETGARLGETEGLRWERVRRFGGERWTVTFEETKNDDARTVGISDELLAMMQALPRRIDGLVFGFRPRRAWRKALEDGGLAHPRYQEDGSPHPLYFTWHDLRHTCASYLAMEGRTRAEIAAQLGHKTLTMTDRYSHLGPSHVLGVTTTMAGKLS